ncbi:hypothetical protein OFY30_003860 [Salmonella enterica]|nr:hypothetical protein [Salmonella enterica subsp. enterica serovar Santiago]EBH8969668.1 hypothetical protein [Salmonella enterica subsp. enterica serovar Santiago]EKP2070240.1 hypothetical protein [Salmonella enterica]EKP2080166.1 hypothetical protein [Salmonella enterica]EKP2108568.1 hypothetical protein [Salmonella enterica]
MADRQSRPPKYEMTVSDIRRKESHERQMMVVESVARVFIQEQIEPQMTLKRFAERYRNGDFQSVVDDANRGELKLVKTEKNKQRKVDMIAYFADGLLNFFNNQVRGFRA